MPTWIILAFVILICFAFTLSNGLHDASSVVATIISSGAASPQQAIILASVFGLLGAVFGGSQVANTISSLIDLPTGPSLLGILFAAIAGAVVWNLATWRLGLPSSSTHALVGGIIGAVTVSSGAQHILWGFSELAGTGHPITGIAKIIVSLVISPVIGFALAFLLGKFTKLIFRNAEFTLNKWLNRVEWVFSAGLSFNHGANDTQKIIGVIVLALAAANGTIVESAPFWVRLCGGLVMFAGTLLGGWSIMKTIGRGIYDIKAIHSVNSQLASAGSVLVANLTGAPVSTTHVVVGSVMGVGASDQYRMVHWSMVKQIIISWVITIPLSAVVSAAIYALISLFF